MAETRVVIQQDPLAEFLNKMPELIFEAKAYGDQLKYQENKDRLNREHEMNLEQFKINQGWMQNLYTKNQDLLDNAANLGLIINQADKLSDTDKTSGFGEITNIFTGNLDSDLTATEGAINSLEKENYDLRKSIGSYNMGSTLFTQVDVNEDGSISDEEKNKYAEDNQGLDIDFDAFAKGLYATELTVKEKADIELSQQALEEATLRNQYLPEKLKNELALQGIDIDKGTVDIKLKNQQLVNMEANYEKALTDIALTELNMDQIKSNMEIAEGTYELGHIKQVKTSLVEQEARDKINANSVAMKLLSSTYLYKKDKVSSLYDMVVAGEAGFMTTETEHWSGEYNDFYQEYEKILGGNASIESDILGLYNAIAMGYNSEDGTFTMSEPFLMAMDEIYSEMENIESGNFLLTKNKLHEGSYISDFDIMKSNFQVETGKSIYDYPNHFLQRVKNSYPEISEVQLIELARYMQFEYSGFDMSTLQENRRLLDNINATNTQLSRITKVETEALDLTR